MPPVQVISGKPTFTGFTYSDGPGGAGSVATTSGTGASTYGKRKVAATWSVTATGSLGLSAPPIPSWDSMCSGNDPFTVMSSSLSGFTGGYSLFFVTGLSSASFSSRGSTDLNVSYKTASSNLDLLDIHLSPTGRRGDWFVACRADHLFSAKRRRRS